MGNNIYYNQSELFFSSIYGSGIYEWNNQYVQDPIGSDNGTGCVSPLLTNKFTGESYYIKRLDCDEVSKNRYINYIKHPVDRNTILWPCDLMELSEKQQKLCSLFISEEYTDNPSEIGVKPGRFAVAFPYGGYPKMISATRYLADIQSPDWKNTRIREMVIQILKSIDAVNRQGYIYTDIHLNRIFFKDNGEVFLNYSNLVYAMKDVFNVHKSKELVYQSSSYPLEFAEPALVQGIQKEIDFETQNYSLCALIFYLFFGRYAYDGRFFDGYKDDTLMNHYIKFRDYHKTPVFIFDPEDKQNALGTFDEEEQILLLWEDCPEDIKELFIWTLRKENAERAYLTSNPTPQTWLRCFKEIGWVK